MPLTPVEVRHLELRRRFFGYRRSSVDAAIDEIATSFEAGLIQVVQATHPGQARIDGVPQTHDHLS